MLDKIGLWPLTALVTGNLVGSGVFLLPAALALYGPLSLVGWVFTSCGAILLALVFSHLSAHNPKTGGPYLYAREAFGDGVGFYICWGYWMLSWIGNPALAVAIVGFLTVIVGDIHPILCFILELAIVGGLTLFNLMGLKVTGKAELYITVLKVVPLLLLPIIGIFFINWDHFSTFNPSGETFGVALNMVAFKTLWAFMGLETGTVPAGQVVNAKRTVPRATLLGTLIATVIYIFGSFVIMGVVSPDILVDSPAPYAEAAHSLFGGSWAIPVAIIGIISCIGTLNGWIIVVGRIPYGAAQDGLFPDAFKKTTSHGTPYWGILISFFCSFPLLLLSLQETLLQQFQFIIDVAITLILIVYAVSILAYFKIFIHHKKFSLGKLALGISALCFSLWTLWATKIDMLAYSLLLFIFGIPMHLWMVKKKGSALTHFWKRLPEAD